MMQYISCAYSSGRSPCLALIWFLARVVEHCYVVREGLQMKSYYTSRDTAHSRQNLIDGRDVCASYSKTP